MRGTIGAGEGINLEMVWRMRTEDNVQIYLFHSLLRLSLNCKFNKPKINVMRNETSGNHNDFVYFWYDEMLTDEMGFVLELFSDNS